MKADAHHPAKPDTPQTHAPAEDRSLHEAPAAGQPHLLATPDEALRPAQVLALQKIVGNRVVRRMLAARARRRPALQRTISPHIADIRTKLSYGLTDWAITDSEAHQVLDWLNALNDTDLRDTIRQMQSERLVDHLLDNISSADRSTYATLIQKIHRARSYEQTLARIQNLLSYGVLDWAITDEEAHEVLVNLQNMPPERRRVLVYRLVESGKFDNLTSNISAADRTAYSALITELEGYRTEHNDLMTGTSMPNATTQGQVEALLTPGIARTSSGAPAAFVDVVGGRTYRQDLEQKLDEVRAWMFARASALLARPRLPMSRFETIGGEAKRVTDALFGRYAQGPAFNSNPAHGTVNLIDRSLQTPDPADLVRYLLTNQREVLPVHTAHSAIPSRAAEDAIIQQIIIDYSAAHRPELEVIDRAWPGIQSGGVVQIQPFEGPTPADTRRQFWRSFQTMIHEYLHSITHEHYAQVANDIGGAQESILIEGGTSLFTDEVWNTVFPDEIQANAELRANVEGSVLPFDASAIPPISHYEQITQAREIRNRVGLENMRAAYFLGHTELIGLGSGWSASGATTGQTFTVPASGVATVADVATATGASAASIATANGIGPADRVSPGQQLTVPGIRIHIVIPRDTRAIIARNNGVSEADLNRANPGVNWGALTEGQRIVIPVH